MSPHQILTVCIRLVAVIWLLYTVSHLDSLFAYLDADSRLLLNKTTVLIFALLQVAACAILWFFPRSIAAKLLPGRDTDATPAPSSSLEWQTLGVVCIGVWALTNAIPDALYWLTFFNMMAELSNLGWAYFSPQQKAAMISTAVELIIGIWLVFGARGLASILFKIRTAGSPHN